MKIALVCASLPPRFTTDTETIVSAQAKELAARGHDVTLVSSSGAVAPEGVRVLGRIEPPPALVGRDAGELVVRDERQVQAVLAAAREVDVVHVHHLAGLDATLLDRLSGEVPVVLSLGDFFSVCPRVFRTPPEPHTVCPSRDDVQACAGCVSGTIGAQLCEAELAARLDSMRAQVAAADRVVVPSRTHLVRLAEFFDFGPGQARLLAPGLCRDLSPRKKRRAAWDGESPLVVVHLGRRSEQDGTLDLVRALAALPDGSVELAAVGASAPGFDESLGAAAPGLPMHLCGPSSTRALVRAVASGHLAAFPSHRPESYALGVDEAIALGFPVWVAGGEAACERYDRSALTLLPPAQPEAWTEAFASWLAEPNQAREAMAALPRAVPTAADAAATLERWYEELARDHRDRDLPASPQHRRPA